MRGGLGGVSGHGYGMGVSKSTHRENRTMGCDARAARSLNCGGHHWCLLFFLLFSTRGVVLSVSH